MEWSADFDKRAKKFAKAHRQELLNAVDNVAAFLSDLRGGLTPQQIIRGYIHDEPHGVKGIDESGPGKHKKAIRLYVYPDEETETLYVLTVGDKSTGKSQSRDIKTCSEFVEGLLKKRESLKGEY